MAEQLSLRLEADLPRPGGVAPMLAKPCGEPFDSAQHLFGPTWGGRRALAFVGPAARAGEGDVRIVGAGGDELGTRLPELAGLAVRVAARSAVLDGELVVVDGRGRIDLPALETRLDGTRGRAVAYLVFDVLHVDGRWLLDQPLARRRARLRTLVRPGDEVLVVPALAREGRALYDAVVAQGLAGVLARDRTSPYLPGVESRLWLSIPAGAGQAREPGRDEGDDTDRNATAPVLALFGRLPLDDPAA